MVKFQVGDFVRTGHRTMDSMDGSWLAPGLPGHITDIGPAGMDPDDFETRENADRSLDVFVEGAEISPGVWADRWEDGDDWFISYGVRLADGRIVSVLQREIEAETHPVALTQMEMFL